DVLITNHPKYGGSHLPDITLLMPVYEHDTGGRLLGYVINRAHHAELGGKRPGSMPPDARNLAEEGVVFPPMLFAEGGKVRWAEIEALLKSGPWPSRSPSENLADLNAAFASLRKGAAMLRELAARHGVETVNLYMTALQNTATEALQSALRPWRGNAFNAEEFLDDGHKIAVHVQTGAEKVCIDFSGSSATHPFNLNANIAIVHSVVIYVLRLLCQREIPLNEGLMRGVEIILPGGSFLHPDFDDDAEKCPAVVGGNTEVSQRITDTLLKALAPLTKTACSQGTMNNLLFGNEHFGYYETIGGGAGAGNGFHGRSAVHQHMTNTRITDPEDLELRYPVRLLRFALRKNSGGNGKWKGGDGIVRELEFLEEVELTILSQHRKEQPYGLSGGSPG
ncbi:MAG: hydantoinase B/oxoprolinase family protein, partial [Bacteroidetes bacterium]